MSKEVIREITQRISQIKSEKRRIGRLQQVSAKQLDQCNKSIAKLDNDILLAEDAIKKLKKAK